MRLQEPNAPFCGILNELTSTVTNKKTTNKADGLKTPSLTDISFCVR